jgi:hypothetical protein
MESFKSRLVNGTVTVTTTATALPATAATGRSSLSVKNNGAVTIYVGSSTVTSANGYPLAPNAEISFDVGDQVIVYGITASGSADIRVLEGV